MASTAWRRVHDTIRWIPFVFIVSIIAFAVIILTDLHVGYGMVKRGWYVSSLIDMLIGYVLAVMALWSFAIAVFQSPGYPPGVLPRQNAFTQHDNDESRWERHHRLREEQIGLTNEADEEEDEDNGIGWQDGRQSHEEPLLSSGASQRRSNRPDPTMDVFDAGAVPLPGQPTMPSRTGRAQLDDVMAIVERAQRERPDGRVFLGDIQVKNTGDRRWCKQCSCYKPDRAHHCSTCGVCVLRMDHHCPWLASKCIGLRNHKAFFLFLFYTALFCCFAGQDVGRGLLRYVEDEKNGYETSPIAWAIVLFLGVIFGLALVPFCAYHAYLICRNRTTLESMEGAGRVRIAIPRSANDGQPPRPSVSDRLRQLAGGGGQSNRRRSPQDDLWKRDEELTREERKTLRRANKLNVYDIGAARNWRCVMGDRWPMWWVPMGVPDSDGEEYEVNAETLRRLEEITASVRNAQANAAREEAAGEGAQTSKPGNPAFSSPISSVRSKARSSSTSSSTIVGTTSSKHASRTSSTTDGSVSAADRHKNAHGIAAWGAPPKRDFILYGLDDEEDDVNSGGVLTREERGQTTSKRANEQMDADVWS